MFNGKKHYCFCGISKEIKSTKKMEAAYRHNYRLYDVKNADGDLEGENEEIVSLNGKTLTEAFEERLSSLDYYNDHNIRKNQVLCYEVVTSFSRECYEDVDIEKWKADNAQWLKSQFDREPEKYGSNVLSVVYHGDEMGNVHCHAFVMPVDERGHLCARSFTGTPQKMREIQDSYGKFMEKEHGLERGERSTGISHREIRKFYGYLDSALSKTLPKVRATVHGKETAEEYRDRVGKLYEAQNSKLLAQSMELDRQARIIDALKRNAEKEAQRIGKELEESEERKQNLEAALESMGRILSGMDSLPEDERKEAKKELYKGIRYGLFLLHGKGSKEDWEAGEKELYEESHESDRYKEWDRANSGGDGR